MAKKEQRVFTQECKREAVQLAETSGKSMTQIARDLGISDSVLHAWRKQFAAYGNQAFPGKGHQTELEEEDRRLRRENDILKQEREVLKKPFVSLRRVSCEISVHAISQSGVSHCADVPCS